MKLRAWTDGDPGTGISGEQVDLVWYGLENYHEQADRDLIIANLKEFFGDMFETGPVKLMNLETEQLL